MIQSILVYTGTALSMYYITKNTFLEERVLIQTQNKKLPFWSSGIIIPILIFAFISGIRYRVGVDYPTYHQYYIQLEEYGKTFGYDFEIGFSFLSELFANLNLHFSFYFGFWAALQIGFVFYAFRNEKYLLPYICILIILGSYYLSWMNGIRQCIVACAFVYSIEFIEKKKLWKFLLFVLLAFTFHKSVVILLPFYFILTICKTNWLMNKKRNLLILFICVFLGNTPTWLNYMNSLENILSAIGYEGYSNRLETLTTKGLQEMVWGPGRISIFAMYLLIIWYYPELKALFKGKKLDMYFFLCFIGVCAYNLFANTSHIFLRPIEYFTIFTLPMSAYLLYFLRKTQKIIPFYAFLILACSNTYITILKTYLSYNYSTDYYLFKFFWDFNINY